MPLTESDEEILFHQPANVNETPDSADAQRKNAPPAKRVVRPSAESRLSDVIRHQPPPERAAAREVPKAQPSTPAKVPAAPSSSKASAHEEFAAAAARARAAVNQQLLDSEAKKAAEQKAVPATAKRIPEARQPGETPVQPRQRPAASPVRQTPAPAAPSQSAQAEPAAQTASPKQVTRQAEPAQAAQARTARAPQKTPADPEPVPARTRKADSGQAARVASPAANQAPAGSPAPGAAAPKSPAAQRSEQGQPRAAQLRAQVLTEPEARDVAGGAARPQPAPQPDQRARRESGTSFLLHTHGLKKVYDGRAVVNGVEVTVRPSEIVGLLGPNGAGKTTTFYMIVGLIQPNGGSVTFDGKDATHQPMYRRARLGMGYLPQEESIFRKLSVEDNILAVMETQDVPRSERRDRCYELMKRFGIERLAKNEAITLSGGEKRRLTIARSLVTNPKLLMLDEPFSGVDPIAVGEIQEIVRSLREQGLAILITDHNVRETLDIVDRAYLLFEGRVEREGTRDFLINDPLSRQLYLGERFSM